jgi:TIR domain-containing protein
MRLPLQLPMSELLGRVSQLANDVHVRLALTPGHDDTWVARSLVVDVFPDVWLDSPDIFAEAGYEPPRRPHVFPGQALFFLGMVKTQVVVAWSGDPEHCELRDFDPGLGQGSKVQIFRLPGVHPDVTGTRLASRRSDGFATLPWPHVTYRFNLKDSNIYHAGPYEPLYAQGQGHFDDFREARAKLIHAVTDLYRVAFQDQDTVAIRIVDGDGWIREVRKQGQHFHVAVGGSGLYPGHLILKRQGADNEEQDFMGAGTVTFVAQAGSDPVEFVLTNDSETLDRAHYVPEPSAIAGTSSPHVVIEDEPGDGAEAVPAIPAVPNRIGEGGVARPAHLRGEGAFEFDVAISFAGPQRQLAERLATIVKDAGFTVFYDNFYPDHLWGKDLPVFFDEIYQKKSQFCVPFLSQEYIERMWTTWERRSATARVLAERGKEYLLPIMVENVEVPGIPTTIGYLSLADRSIEDIADILVKKLTTAMEVSHGDHTQRQDQVAAARHGRLGADAQVILDYIARNHGLEDLVQQEAVAQATGMASEQLADALHALRDAGLIKLFGNPTGGGAAFQVQVRGWEYVDASVAGFNYWQDMLTVATTAGPHQQMSRDELLQETGLPEKRLDIAALLLREHGYIKLVRPAIRGLTFSTALTDHRTRQFVKDQQG